MDVKLPNLGEGADSGTVVNLFVKEGDRIEKDQPVLELENEKAVATIPSTASGVITKIHVKSGDKISAGARLISVSDNGAPEAAKPAAAKPKAEAPARAVTPVAAPALVEEAEEEEVGEATPAEDVTAANQSVAAAPSIRKMAIDLGIDLRRVRGSGRGGRIELPDVRAYIQRLMRSAAKPAAGAAEAKPAPERVDFSKWGEITKKPLSPLRQVISRRMSESWAAVPRVTQFDEADVSGLVELRKKYAPRYEKKGARLTLTPFVLKAVVSALKLHPLLNASLDEVAQEIVLKQYYHIGMAVDTEAGLIVPVIRDVDRKNLVELSKELEDVAKRARDRKVSGEELKGGTFTISNQGGIGGGAFTPVVNLPEAAILGMGRSALKPVVRDGKIEARTMLPLGLSYDHRVIDGGEAARFTVDLVKALENFREEDVKI